MQERTSNDRASRRRCNSPSISFSAACAEVLKSVKCWEFWLTLAWADTLSRYRRTLLGPFWTTLNSTLFVVILAFVYSLLWRIELRTFLPFVAAGYFTWTFFSACVNESCGIFHAHAETLKTVPIPPATLLLRVVARNSVNFFHNLVVFAGIALIFAQPLWLLPIALAGLVILALFCLGIGLTLAFLCSRFRDFEPIVSNLLIALFFVTPILWQPRLLPAGSEFLAEANVIFHLVSVVRDPMLDRMPSLTSYAVAATAATGAILLGLTCYARFRRRLAYWL
jgi:ABC-type polysaccharide/polyol phosphate export permease